MNEEIIKKLIELVQRASPQLWEMAMRQVWINNVENGLFFVFFVGVVWVGLRLVRRYNFIRAMWDADYEYYDALNAVIGGAGGCMMVLVGFPVAASYVHPLLTGLFNPQYAALYNLLSLVTK